MQQMIKLFLLFLALQAPNGMGAILGIIQLVLYSYYKSTSRQDSQGPLIESYDHERRY